MLKQFYHFTNFTIDLHVLEEQYSNNPVLLQMSTKFNPNLK